MAATPKAIISAAHLSCHRTSMMLDMDVIVSFCFVFVPNEKSKPLEEDGCSLVYV